jgi:hypothetical protein
MPHIVFIHGLSNKPEADYLYKLWKRKLAFNDGLDLDTNGVTSSMVYWADVLYPSPDTDLAAYEAVKTAEEVLKDGTASTGVDQYVLSDEEKKVMEPLRERLQLNDVSIQVELTEKEMSDISLERVPVPGWLRDKIMEKFVRDAYLYFYNKEFSPRLGKTYKLRDELRKRFLVAVAAVPEQNRPLIVVSHSMGTIIAYDCMKHEPGCAKIDGLMTTGSPLGIDEVQDFFPNWDSNNGYPFEKLTRRWVNIFDRLDVVADADPELANDYQKSGIPYIDDIEEANWGTWRHSISKYLQGEKLRKNLADMLKVTWP